MDLKDRIVLVNNAGIYASGPIDKFDAAIFDRLVAVKRHGRAMPTSIEIWQTNP
jgi:NAD(P)-dependent dehydrogenase (short-subunit alcohol dehydrogenase family)